MAITLGQVTQARNNSTITLTGVTAGSMLILMNVASAAGPASDIALTDSSGDTWTHYFAADAGGAIWSTSIYFAKNVATGTHTLTYLAPAVTNSFIFAELIGASTTDNPYGAAVSTNEGFGGDITADVNVLNANDAVIGCALPAGDGAVVAPTLDVSSTYTAGGQAFSGWYVAGSTGNHHLTFNNAIAENSVIGIKAPSTPSHPELVTTSFLVD